MLRLCARARAAEHGRRRVRHRVAPREARAHPQGHRVQPRLPRQTGARVRRESSPLARATATPGLHLPLQRPEEGRGGAHIASPGALAASHPRSALTRGHWALCAPVRHRLCARPQARPHGRHRPQRAQAVQLLVRARCSAAPAHCRAAHPAPLQHSPVHPERVRRRHPAVLHVRLLPLRAQQPRRDTHQARACRNVLVFAGLTLLCGSIWVRHTVPVHADCPPTRSARARSLSPASPAFRSRTSSTATRRFRKAVCAYPRPPLPRPCSSPRPQSCSSCSPRRTARRSRSGRCGRPRRVARRRLTSCAWPGRRPAHHCRHPHLHGLHRAVPGAAQGEGAGRRHAVSR